MVYQDHFAKFSQLRPLKTKTAIEVASGLVGIFTVVGVPMIRQSHNCKEFRNNVAKAFEQLWSGLLFVHGRARHPLSQGSVERANVDTKLLLAAWMPENKSKKWNII